MRIFLIFFILITLGSCSQKPAEEIAKAIDIALSHLTKGECDEALRVLNDVDDGSESAIYLQVLASAHACKGNFNEIAFIANDLAGLDTTDTAAIMTSLATMTLSPETAADSANYESILTAINVILNSTTGDPSQVTREATFGTRGGGDMGMQALFLNLVNLGKFLNYYGNVDAAGAKGQGTNSNSCFINYTDPRAQLAIAGGAGGVCAVSNDGHPDLDYTTDDGKRRLCEGLMTFTNIIDILENLTFPSTGNFSKLADVAAEVSTIKADATTAGLGTLINMTSQTDCETAMDVSTLDMQFLYSLLFEAGLQ